MGRIRSRKSTARYYTPPPDLTVKPGQHPRTPCRSGVIWAKVFSQKLNIPIPQSLVRQVTGITESAQTRILSSKQPRTFHNFPDFGPDSRGRKRALRRSDTAAIADYLNDENVSLDDRGPPWQDVAEAAGVSLPQTIHLKPHRLRTVTPKTIQKACRDDEDIINTVCEEEKELDKKQARLCREFANKHLEIRPYSDDWDDVAFCDEFHLGVGPQVTKRVKRKRGKAY